MRLRTRIRLNILPIASYLIALIGVFSLLLGTYLSFSGRPTYSISGSVLDVVLGILLISTGYGIRRSKQWAWMALILIYLVLVARVAYYLILDIQVLPAAVVAAEGIAIAVGAYIVVYLARNEARKLRASKANSKVLH